MTQLGSDWREIDGVATAWFDAASLVEGAALAHNVIELAGDPVVDVRAAGVRVRLGAAEHATAVSAAARGLGLVANPAALQQLSVVIESAATAAMRPFWEPLLGDVGGIDGALADPWGRDPKVRLASSSESRPLRNRIHLDVGLPAVAFDELELGEGSGPYDVRHADADGNEVDVVPGDPLGDADAVVVDWQAVFAAMACYRTSELAQQAEVVSAVAALAGGAGFPLLVDVRPGLVIVDSAKDQFEPDAHGLDVEFADLAASIQVAVRQLGGVADLALPRFVQLVVDAVDIGAVRAFWAAALGYVEDRRAGVTDLYDPRRLGPVLVFQDLDAADAERRRQRNRIHLELAVPADVIDERLATALAAGGELLDESPGRWCVADPEGNELELVASS